MSSHIPTSQSEAAFMEFRRKVQRAELPRPFSITGRRRLLGHELRFVFIP